MEAAGKVVFQASFVPCVVAGDPYSRIFVVGGSVLCTVLNFSFILFLFSPPFFKEISFFLTE